MGNEKVASKKKPASQKELMRAKGYIPVSEAAKRVGLSVWRIYELLNEERLKGMTVGGGPHARRYVESKSLIDYMGPEASKALGLV